MIRRSLALLGASALCGAAAAQPLWERMEQCATLLAQSGGDDEPPRLLSETCPGVADAVAASAWADALLSGPGALDAQRLTALAGVARFYTRETSLTPEPEALEAILAELGPFGAVPELTLWDRAMRWLASWIDERTGDTGQRLLDWLRDVAIPDTWIRAVIYAVTAGVVLLGLLVIVNEARSAGLLGRRRPRPGGARAADARGRATPVRLEDLGGLPLAKQPSALLAMIVARLRAREPRAARPSLTHRELAAAGATLGRAQAAALALVAGAAERVTYGAWMPRAEELAPVLAEGRALIEQLGDAPEDGA